MARINPASLRAQLDDCRARFDVSDFFTPC